MELQFDFVNANEIEDHPLREDIERWKSQPPHVEETSWYSIKYMKDGKKDFGGFSQKDYDDLVSDPSVKILNVSYIPQKFEIFNMDHFFMDDSDSRIYFIYTDSMELIGIALYQMIDNVLEAIEINPEYRGKGLFKVFLDHVFSDIRDRSIKTFSLVNGIESMGVHSYSSAGKRNGFRVKSFENRMIFYNDITDVGKYLIDTGFGLAECLNLGTRETLYFEKFNPELSDEYEHIDIKLAECFDLIKKNENLVMRTEIRRLSEKISTTRYILSIVPCV
jgi:GNAT superfamily N-acetyltransferase